LQQKAWIEQRMRWLQREFGTNRTSVPVLVPPHLVPAEWNGTPEECESLLTHLCEYMEVPRSSIRVHYYADATDRFHLPVAEPSERGAAGIYHGRTAHGAFIISLAEEQLEKPEPLVAAMSHELGHVHLLGGNRLQRGEPDHEKLADLLAVYFGAGLFLSTAYLDAAELAYALACYAWLRGEHNPPWREHVALPVASRFDDAIHYLVKTRDISLLRAAN
jgi:hypothetical protein